MVLLGEVEGESDLHTETAEQVHGEGWQAPVTAVSVRGRPFLGFVWPFSESLDPDLL